MSERTTKPMSNELDQIFSNYEGNVTKQIDQLELLKSALAESLAKSTPERMSKDILGGAFVNAPAGGTGGTPMSLRPYDLLRPAQLVTPADTPLRNSIPRDKGMGGAFEFRQILGLPNASFKGTGASLVQDININTDSETLSNTFGGLTGLRRGPIIKYASNQKWVPYTEQSVSDNISYRAVYSSLGFEDPRQLSALALLRSHMRGEEQTLLLGRGPLAGGFAGPFNSSTAPSTVVASAGAAISGANFAGTATIQVTYRAGVGESPASTAGTAATIAAGDGIAGTLVAPPAGAYGTNVYLNVVTSSAGLAVGTYFAGFYPSNFAGAININPNNVVAGATAPSSDTTSSNGYDGLLTVALNQGNLLTATGTFTSKGDTDLQTLFANGYQAYEWDPDEVWLNVAQAQGLATFLRSGASGSANSGYRLNLQGGGENQIGEIVTGVRNASSPTQKLVDIRVHPFMPVGMALVRSKVVPASYQATGVGNTAEVRCVQDYSLFEWPSIDFQYAASTYAMTTMAHYAPFLQGVVTGIGAS
jgi:hypothetical protein